MFAYDSKFGARPHFDEEVAEPDNADAINEIVRWISQNLSPDETLQLYNELGKLDATSPSDQSKNEQMRMQEAETEDEPPEFHGKPSPGGNINTSAPRREPSAGRGRSSSGGLPVDKARSGYLSGGDRGRSSSGGLPMDRDRTSRPSAMDMAFDEMFPEGKRIGLSPRGYPANTSQSRMAFDQQSVAAFEELFPEGKRIRV